MEKPIIVFVFAENDLARVGEEKELVKEVIDNHDDLNCLIVEKADVRAMGKAAREAGKQLFMFHFGGHANDKGIILDGFLGMDRNRLSRILLPQSARNPFQLLFLNGCESYGNVGVFTAKGVKAVSGSRNGDYQPLVPGSPLNGPTTSDVIQPP